MFTLSIRCTLFSERTCQVVFFRHGAHHADFCFCVLASRTFPFFFSRAYVSLVCTKRAGELVLGSFPVDVVNTVVAVVASCFLALDNMCSRTYQGGEIWLRRGYAYCAMLVFVLGPRSGGGGGGASGALVFCHDQNDGVTESGHHDGHFVCVIESGEPGCSVDVIARHSRSAIADASYGQKDGFFENGS